MQSGQQLIREELIYQHLVHRQARLQRLEQDHAMAQRLAAGLQGLPGLSVRSAQTNVVFLDVTEGRGPALLAHLKGAGVLATGMLGLRFVTHLDVDAAGIDRAIAAIRAFVQAT